MQKYSNSVQDTAGNAIEAASVSVYDHGTENLSTIYSDNGSTVTTNPQTTNSLGEFSFYAADGRYDIKVSKTGITTQNLLDIILYDPAASSGSAGVGFLQSGSGPIAEDLQSRGRWFAMVTDDMTTAQRSDVFTNTGSVDTLAAWNTAVTDAVANRLTLLVPAGTYALSGKLELGHSGLRIMPLGKVILKHTGTGVAVSFDGGASSGSVYGVDFGCGSRIYITGNASTTDLIFARSCHHSKISANVRNGTTALDVNFCVLTDFDVVCSSNEGAFTTQPTNAVLTNRRGAGENTADCTFDIIAEGTSGYGVDLQYAQACTFYGTSEGNGGGVRLRSTSANNNFRNFDCESNGSSNQDWLIEGDRNNFFGCISALTTTAPATSVTGARNKFQGGSFSSITASGDYNEFDALAISGTRTFSSVFTKVTRCVDSTGALIPTLDVRTPRLFDDFFGAALSTMWGSKKGSNGSCNVVGGQSITGGVCRLVTGADAGGTLALNGAQLDQGVLQWKTSQGGLAVEIRIKTDAITNLAWFVGLTDQASTLEIPANGTGGGDGITFTATDCIGFVFDTTMTTTDWWAVAVKAGVQTSAQDTTFAPVANTYQTFRIEIISNGNATFYRNGAVVGTAVSAAITTTAGLSPVICAFSRTGTSVHIDCDYVMAEGSQV